MKRNLITFATLLLTFSTSSFAAPKIAPLLWQDKGAVKQTVTAAACKINASDSSLHLVKEYRLFEINSEAFWSYLHKTGQQFVSTRIPLPDGSTTSVRLDKHSPIQSEYPEVSRSFQGKIYKPKTGFLNGTFHELKQPTLLGRNIFIEVTLEGEASAENHYSVYIEPLKKLNTYAVYDSRNIVVCPRKPVPRGFCATKPVRRE